MEDHDCQHGFRKFECPYGCYQADLDFRDWAWEEYEDWLAWDDDENHEA